MSCDGAGRISAARGASIQCEAASAGPYVLQTHSPHPRRERWQPASSAACKRALAPVGFFFVFFSLSPSISEVSLWVTLPERSVHAYRNRDWQQEAVAPVPPLTPAPPSKPLSFLLPHHGSFNPLQASPARCTRSPLLLPYHCTRVSPGMWRFPPLLTHLSILLNQSLCQSRWLSSQNET